MTANGSLQLSRREFLVVANAAALLALVESCVPGGLGRQAASSVPAGGSAYERALLLLREAVRASPDHLAIRATDLVAARDATKIVEFVRDRIAVVPPFWFLADHRTATRWGAAATMRGGQGTLRERADILAGMLTRAGFPAQVMSANRPAAIGLSELYRQRAVQFAPDLQRIDLAKTQLRQAGAPAPASPQAFDAGPDPLQAILAALPASLQKVQPRPDLLPPQVPVVVFDQSGKKRYAFALGDMAASDSAPAGLASLGAADTAPTVTITVSAVSNPAPGSKTPRGHSIDLVSGKWPADTIVGHQVLLTFMPPRGPKAYLDSRLSVQTMRVPVLRVQVDAPPVGAATNLTLTGPLISVRGDVVATAPSTPNGVIEGPFGSIQVLSDADRKQAAARVTTMQAAANATAFPEIDLEVTIGDGAGQSVDGLDARSLTIKENGKAVDGFTVLANARSQSRPRVLIVYDTSSSVTQTWPTPAAKLAFEKDLGAAVTGAGAQVPFDVQVIGTGTAPDPTRWAAPDAAAIASAMAAASWTDETWATIAGPALDQGVVAIVVAGDTGDDMTAPREVHALQSRLAGTLVPVFCVPLGRPADAAVATIVSVSGGARVDPKDLSKLGGLLQPVLARWVGGAYRMRYVASADGPTERKVTVSLNDRSQPQATTTYHVPATPLPPPSFVSLYVTIEVGGLRSVRRLAGLTVVGGRPIGALDDPAAIAETRAAIDGITTIATEPGTPTSAALLDDVVTSLLSFEPLRPIWPTASADQILAAAKNGVRRTPGLLASLLSSGRMDPAAVPALKVAILQERAPSDALIERHVDLAIGANPVIAVTADGHVGFKAAVANSVAACAAEAATFDDSAYRRLSGRQLMALPYGDLGARTAFFKTVPPEKLDPWTELAFVYQDFHMLVPASGAGDAFWLVDPDTGVTKAMLLDGTGGAVIRESCHFSGYDNMAITLAVLSILCAAAEDVFPVICIGINTAAIGMTVAGLFDPTKADPGTPFGAAFGVFNPLGKSFGGLGATIGVALILVTIQSSCS